MTNQRVGCNSTKEVFFLFVHLNPLSRTFKAAIVALNKLPKRENAGLSRKNRRFARKKDG